mgnify:CR=1 FL=1
MSWEVILKNKRPKKVSIGDVRHKWKDWIASEKEILEDDFNYHRGSPRSTKLDEYEWRDSHWREQRRKQKGREGERKKEKIRESYEVPKNYNKIQTIVQMLKHQNKEINKVNILKELDEVPTVEDNEAIEYILSR